MRLPSYKIIFFLSFAISATAHSAIITNSELPGTIQSCITSTTCFVSNMSSYDSGTVSAYQVFQSTSAGNPYEQSWLVRYNLAPPSGQSRLNPPLSDSFNGYLWMLTKNTYNVAETAHPFTLYLDKVSPTFSSIFNQSGDISLFMTTADLLAGSGYRTSGLDINTIDYSYGNLSGQIPPYYCLAPTCQTNVQLNLVQLMYADSGTAGILFTFNPADTRGLVFTQSLSYSGLGDPSAAINDVQSFYVSAVPLPGTLWLFGSGLVGLIGVIRRSHHRK